MSNLVIVALPREDDPVWKISSEKVPHMTILFLGSADNPDRAKMAEFLEHAASTTLTRFYLDVDRRGKLGEDEADVVFFQDSWDLPRLEEFRSQLLKFDAIKTAYDSTPQYEGWTPHLTLGYPETPAKPTDERIYMVGFDRIALWDGDYQGVEFLLKSNDVSEVMMSDQAAIGQQFLAHYGVKGMKWGVRKSRPTSKEIRTARLNVHAEVSALNAQAHKVRRAGSEKEKAKQIATYKKMHEVHLNNPDRATAARITAGERWVLGVLAVGLPGPGTAAAIGYTGGQVGMRKLIEREQKKRKQMAQMAPTTEEFLAHYGVKGMKWGVRKRRETKGAEAVEKIGFTGKTKVKAQGGTGQKASQDAIDAAIKKQTLKKSGPAALSNQELRELATRLQLEQQVTQLAGSPAQKFVSRQLGGVANQQTQRVANQKAAELIDAQLRKKK